MTGDGVIPPPPEEPTQTPPPGPPQLPAPPPPGSRAAAGEPVPPRAIPPHTPPASYLPPPAPRPRRVMSPIEPLPPERSGPPPWVWVLAGVAAAAILAVVLVLVLRSGSSGPLVVGTDVALDATTQQSGSCVTTVHLTAHGSLSGSGTLVYRFDRSDGQSTGDSRLDVNGNTGFEITEDWRFVGVHQGGGTMIFRIVSPTTREVRHDVSVTCP